MTYAHMILTYSYRRENDILDVTQQEVGDETQLEKILVKYEENKLLNDVMMHNNKKTTVFIKSY